MEVYVVCEERICEFAQLEVGHMAEVRIGMRGGMGNEKRAEKFRNLWISSDESEPEKVRSESSSAEEVDGKKIQEELEKKATQALEEGGRNKLSCSCVSIDR